MTDEMRKDELEELKQALIEQNLKLDEQVGRRRDWLRSIAPNNFPVYLSHTAKDEETGKYIELGEIHYSWINHVHHAWNRRNKHAVIMAPFGHGKTQLFAVHFPLWLIGRHPHHRIKVISAADELAIERVTLIRQYIEEDEDFKFFFPNIVPANRGDWTKHRLVVARPGYFIKDPTIEAKGILATGIGGRADFEVFDDPNDMRNTLVQPALRKVIYETYQNVWLSRLSPKGKVLIIMTRWHDSDMAGMILRDPLEMSRYCILIQKVRDDLTGIDVEYFEGINTSRERREAVKAMEKAHKSYDKVVEAEERRTPFDPMFSIRGIKCH